MLLIFTIFLDDVRKKMYGQIKKNKTIIDFIPKKPKISIFPKD